MISEPAEHCEIKNYTHTWAAQSDCKGITVPEAVVLHNTHTDKTLTFGFFNVYCLSSH